MKMQKNIRMQGWQVEVTEFAMHTPDKFFSGTNYHDLTWLHIFETPYDPGKRECQWKLYFISLNFPKFQRRNLISTVSKVVKKGWWSWSCFREHMASAHFFSTTACLPWTWLCLVEESPMTYGYWALKRRLVWIETFCKRKIHTGFWRLHIKRRM